MSVILRRWNIAAGNFFFRYRNALFPVTIGLTVLCLRPRVLFGHPRADRLFGAAGMVVALVGELVRLTTIGFDYIERGGRQGRVYASHLVHGGVYALTRNPMYIGNLLIVIGIVMVSGSPAAYLLVIPAFLVIYQAIIAAEEQYLRTQFGPDYDRYCAEVPRWMPALRRIPQAFACARYQWRPAIRKELSTMAGLFTGLSLLPLWRTYFLKGAAAAKAAAPRAALCTFAVLGLYGFLVWLKRRRRFFYLPSDFSGLAE